MLILTLIYFKCRHFLELEEIFYNYFNLMFNTLYINNYVTNVNFLRIPEVRINANGFVKFESRLYNAHSNNADFLEWFKHYLCFFT